MKRAMMILGALATIAILLIVMTHSAQAQENFNMSMQQRADPTITIAPNAGPPGTQLWVLATGFPAHSGVNLGFTVLPLVSDNLRTSTRSDANGTINTFVIVPDTVLNGEQWYIVAVTPDNIVRKISPAFTVADVVSPITTPELGFVVDNTDTATTEGGFPGGWNAETVDGYGGQLEWTENSESRADRYEYFRWHTEGLTPGNYEVYVFIPSLGATTTHAPYWIHSSRGYTSVIVDQSANQGRWVSLGRYYFGQDQGMDQFVSISDVTGEPLGTTQVAVDAVLFVPR
jgi:hypothetical protein